MNELEPVYVDDFEKIRQIIEQARQEAAYKVMKPSSVYIGTSENSFRRKHSTMDGDVPL